MGKKNKSPRRQAREKAFQILYGCSFSFDTDKEHVYRTFRNFMSEDQGSDEVESFAWELITGVIENKATLDRIISSFSKNWRLERIAKIELTILRLAVFEMFYREDVPLKVAINEGVELSKKYGDSKSSGFVNGILDAIARNQGEEKVREPILE